MITAATLQAATGCTPDRAVVYAGPLTQACARYGIEGPRRLAMFLAQIGHESGGLKYTREIWGPTPVQARYEGRADLGNVQPGDGERFRGRGLIQLTGRYNAARMRDRLRAVLGDQVPDFEADPEALELPQWAAMTAAAYWDHRGCNELADSGDFDTITRRINGGMNGIEDRRRRLRLAEQALAAPTTQPEAPAIQPAPVTPPKAPTMSLPAILAALLPSLVSIVPKLGELFGSGSKMSERNIAAAGVVFDVARKALGAANEQEVVQRIQNDPAAAQTVRAAIEGQWYSIVEAGGGGIDGARRADAATAAAGGFWVSPSFWMGVLLLPLVYMIVGNVIGLFGSAEWSPDARAGLAGALSGTIIGGLVGYYYGQVTSRNRESAARLAGSPAVD